MKKFPHQEFIEDNNLNIQSLPEMLQKRIKGFDELEEDLQHTTEEDQEKLLNKLEMLSHQLEEDLEEHFEQHLENNDEQEDEPEVSAAPAQEEKDEEPSPEPESPVEEPLLEPVMETTDEEILEGLVADKKRRVFPAELKERGFKTNLDSKKLLVGKFCLLQGKYDTCYRITLKNE